MTTLKNIQETLETIAPLSLQCDWDNSGLLVDAYQPIERVLLCLDVTNEVVEEAVEYGAQLIISHHPVIFSGLKRIDSTHPVYRLCANDISCIAMHTNLDAAQGGVNDRLAELFSLTEVELFDDIGRMGRLAKPLAVTELAVKAKALLGASPRFYDSGKVISTLAVLGGAGNVVEKAYDVGADCLLTGELKYDGYLTAQRLGISVVEAGHFCTEWPVMSTLCERLTRHYGAEVTFMLSDVAGDPTTTL